MDRHNMAQFGCGGDELRDRNTVGGGARIRYRRAEDNENLYAVEEGMVKR